MQPINHFFQQQIRPTPTVNTAYWSFVLRGLVDIPLFLSYNDLLALPAVEIPCAIACIGSPPDGSLIESALWRGVRFQTLLDEIIVQPNAHFANFYAADGYVTSISLDKLPEALLVYDMNGKPLAPEHGSPARLVVPGLYGYKMPKWIQRVELTAEPVLGIWEQRGWSASGEVQTTSAILSPQHLETTKGVITFSGIAYAGNRTITNVELSIDNGPWMPAPFYQESPNHLARWEIDWMPYAPGDYQVQVRASDSKGFIQAGDGPVFPNGSNAIHSIIVRAAG